MKTYRITIRPDTAFGSALLGETIFGQLCWIYRSIKGDEALSKSLEHYTDGAPFLVVSDAFVSKYLPLPNIPSALYDASDKGLDRKALKKKIYIKSKDISKKVSTLRNVAFTEAELFADDGSGMRQSQKTDIHTHATLNRMTGCTGDDIFAPYIKRDTFFKTDLMFDIYAVADEEFVSEDLLGQMFALLGLSGYGRDASAGLGKFSLKSVSPVDIKVNSKSVMTLASCSPCVEGIDPENTYYRTKTHFGRHGDLGALSANPFKNPVLLAKAGAVLSFKNVYTRPFAGQGLTGLSNTIKCTVHQGYAPVVPIDFDRVNQDE